MSDPQVDAHGKTSAQQHSATRASSTIGTSGGNGQPLPGSVRSYFEPRFQHDFSNVRVHTDARSAKAAQSMQARAFTLSNDVVFGEGQYAPATSVGRKLLAHELAHVVQHSQQNSQNVIHRTPRPETRNEALVRRSRERLEVLEPLLTQLRIQSTRTLQERLEVLPERQALDATIVEPAPPGQRQRAEDVNTSQLNRLPLQIRVNGSAVTFRVSFQVQFEDSAMGDQRYGELVSQMRAGIEMVWNQRLSGNAFGGRSFQLLPRFTRVNSNATRDLNHWLIVVRAQDLGVVTYPGCTLDATDPAIPTSVTDSTCDGGIMSVPPRHVSRPSVLGHETLHLFGLVDRYMSLTSIVPGQAPVVVNDPSRETAGRPDPLGTADGKILHEDLRYLFVQFGVYDEEISRLRSGIAFIERDVHRLREIVRLGREPHSLMDSVIRRDFNDRIFESAEDI